MARRRDRKTRIKRTLKEYLNFYSFWVKKKNCMNTLVSCNWCNMLVDTIAAMNLWSTSCLHSQLFAGQIVYESWPLFSFLETELCQTTVKTDDDIRWLMRSNLTISILNICLDLHPLPGAHFSRSLFIWTNRQMASMSYAAASSAKTSDSTPVSKSNSRTVICLLRNDLRYHDNEALQWAHR